MRRVGIAAAALVWLIGSPAAAEDSLVVVDSVGANLGPVVGRSGPSNHNWVDFLARDGTEFLVLSANAGGVFGLTGTLYFPESDCNGTRYWSGDPFTVGDNLTPPVTVTGFDVYTIDEGSTHSINSLSHIHAGSSAMPQTCHAAAYLGLPVRDVALVGSLAAFTPPLHLDLNPLVFNDGFATGDTARWNVTLP